MIKRMCVALVVFLAACSSIAETAGAPDLRLAVAGELFVRSPETGAARVPFVLQNRGTATLRVPRCGDAIVVESLKAEGSTWMQYGTGACPANLNMVPVAVKPGASVEGTWIVREPGRFRIRVVAGCDCQIQIGYPAESYQIRSYRWWCR